jgi:hypothetical protein
MKSTNRLLYVMAYYALASLTAAAATYYVWGASPNPSPPFTTWATAAHTINAAIDFAQPGDTVLVTNGVYTSISVAQPIILVSVKGPSVTIINGGGINSCANLWGNVLMSGFTLTNGNAVSGGGVWCGSTNPVLTNCILTGNSAYAIEGGDGGGVSGGILYACIIAGNSANGHGGGAHSSTLYNCTLTGNWAYYGGGAYAGTLNDCNLSGNSAVNGGGFSASDRQLSSVLNRCTLTGNSASLRGGGASGGTMNYCKLEGNWARQGGGAFRGIDIGRVDCTLNKCTLTGNLASDEGGGAYGCSLNSCLLTGNSAGEGGGAYGIIDGENESPCTLINCTLIDNSASWFGGGARNCALNNCILYYNTAPRASNWDGGALNYCCTIPLPSFGVGNIQANQCL